MQHVPINLEILLSSPFFLCHTVWILLIDSFQKEQKKPNVAFSYGKSHWCGVIFNGFASNGIDVYSVWECCFPRIYQFTISWHPKKVYFSLLTHTTHILSNLKKGFKVDVDNSLSWKDQIQENIRIFIKLFEVLLKVWEILAAGLRLLNCTYAVLIAEEKKLTESINQKHSSLLLSDLPLAF